MMIDVQFSDSAETTIVSWFACPQDPTVYPNQGQVDTSDNRYKAFFDARPVSMQKGLPAPA